jgi:hypothetical protein
MGSLSFLPRRALLATAALVAFSAPAQAGPLAPGEVGGGEAFVLNLDDPSFQGETVASSTAPISIETVDPDTGEPRSFTGTFNHRVVRESATGRLAFHYEFLRTGVVGIYDFESFVVGDFTGFTTDVFSDQTALTQARAIRSADGATVEFIGDEENNANVVVRTDATVFQPGGTARLEGEFQPDLLNQDVTFETFRPAADDGGPGPNPIPLPPAAWAALATTGGFGGVKVLRRFKRGS